VNARLVVFADGVVGLVALRIVLADHLRHLAAVVVVDENGDIAREIRSRGLDVPILVWTKLTRPSLASALRQLNPDIFFLSWWPFLLREELECGQRHTLNMHPSLLPFGRGKDPNFWALASDEPFGVTIHHVTVETDAGAIAFQRAIPTGWEDTGATLYDKAQAEILDLFRESMPSIVALYIPTIAQPPGGSFHFRRDLEPASRFALDEATTARSLLNRLRARTFAPQAGCRFEEAGRVYEVRVEIREVQPPGPEDLRK